MASIDTPANQENKFGIGSRGVVYPSSDGKPMAETRAHREAMTYAIQTLEVIFADAEEVWISGNDFLYYAEGEPSRRVSPGCYLVLGVPRGPRPSFKVWEESGRTPNAVWEFTSRKTERQDREEKFDLPAEDGSLESAETGIRMYADGALLRFVHPRTGEVVRTGAEAAEAELARLRAERERVRRDSERADG